MLIHHRDVTGVEPTIGINRFGRLFGRIEISRCDLEAADPQLAFGSGFDIGAGWVDHSKLDACRGTARCSRNSFW